MQWYWLNLKKNRDHVITLSRYHEKSQISNLKSQIWNSSFPYRLHSSPIYSVLAGILLLWNRMGRTHVWNWPTVFTSKSMRRILSLSSWQLAHRSAPRARVYIIRSGHSTETSNLPSLLFFPLLLLTKKPASWRGRIMIHGSTKSQGD